MSTDWDDAGLLARWNAGDETAATAIFDRYVLRLTALARSRLSERLSRRIDADDVVQSAFRSFFVNSAGFEQAESGSLWRLLATMTLNKVRSQARFHFADKRSVSQDAETTPEGGTSPIAELIAREPTPKEAFAVFEELESTMRALPSQQREIFERCLSGLTTEEIAVACRCSDRTVRRTLQSIRETLERQLDVSA
jgi:RNA polymerase sigma factor (sigma-70 family)